MNSIPYKNQILFLIYFGLSVLLTWLFVSASPVYFDKEQQLLSTAIAGGKWGLQILMAFILLGPKKWVFVKNIGFVCFLGSIILIPYILLNQMGMVPEITFFIGSLTASVVTMIYYYYRAVKLSMANLKWWFLWLSCLFIAICLQLTIVFHIF